MEKHNIATPSVLGTARRVARFALQGATQRFDTDRLLQGSMAACLEVASSRYPIDPGAQWQPGNPLKLLLAGYNGTRNTGADVRVEEMIRQFRHLFGDDHLKLSLLTINPALSRGYFRTVSQLRLPRLFPKFLLDTVHRQHGVIACEGSMFKSKFANALSTMMAGALGLAAAENKVAVGYGGEAGAMDPSLAALVRRYCRDTLVVVRNEESARVLGDLGIPTEFGTDTAWTFEAAPASVGEGLLRAAGWDGHQSVLALCPINPFWWPVKPDLLKGALHAATGMYGDSHYDAVYFHHAGPEVDQAQDRYLRAFAGAVRRFREKHNVFPIVVGMEQLDRRAGEALARALRDGPNGRDGGRDVPLFVSDEHDMYTLVSILRQAQMLVASRYHAIVTTMPAGVVSAGITMDERIRNLMRERGQPHLALEVSDPQLEHRLYETLLTLQQDADEIRDGIGRCVVANLQRMGRMGGVLVDYVRARHPEFPFRPGLGTDADPWAQLPPFSPAIAALARRYT